MLPFWLMEVDPDATFWSVYAYVVFLICYSIFLNLLPIPPLDGHWIRHALLPYNASRVLERLGGFGILILYSLMFMGLFKYLLMPIYWILNLLIWL